MFKTVEEVFTLDILRAIHFEGAIALRIGVKGRINVKAAREGRAV